MVQGFDYPDLGGGRNGGAAPHAIDSREMRELKNWYPYAGSRLRRRGGVRRITSTAGWDQNITGMFPLKTADGAWVLLVAGPTKFGKLDGSSVSDLTLGTGLAPITDSGLPWIMFQYLNHAYALRRGHSELIRLTADLALPAGIAAPTSAMTIAQGAAGTLSAADYIAVVTFGNLETGMESNPGPASNTLSLAASKKIDYTGIPVSTNPFVDVRRVYRTLPNQVGEYFFVFQISNNVDTSFSGENVAVADMGSTVSNLNGVPPAGLETGAIWNERLFASDGTDLYFSELLMPEMFSGDVISVFPDDGHVIRGLLAFGDRLLIGKTNKIHYLVGTDRSDFGLHTLSDAHGLMSGHSFKTAEGLAFWFGTGRAIYQTDGTSVIDISTPKVADVLAEIPDGLEEYVVGAVFPKLNWYVLAIPSSQYTPPSGDVYITGEDPAVQNDPDNNYNVLIYNYKYRTWTVFRHHLNAPQFLTDFFDTNYEQVLYATFYDGHIYQYGDESYGLDAYTLSNPTWGTQLRTASIEAVARTKRDDFGYPGYRKFFREVWALVPNETTGQFQIEVFRDDQATAILDRTASLDFGGDSAWKAWAANTFRQPGSTMDMRLTYTGQPQIDLDALHFEVGLLPRKPARAR